MRHPLLLLLIFSHCASAFTLPPISSSPNQAAIVSGIIYRGEDGASRGEGTGAFLFTVGRVGSPVRDALLAAKLKDPNTQRYPLKFDLSLDQNGVNVKLKSQLLLDDAKRREISKEDLLVQVLSERAKRRGAAAKRLVAERPKNARSEATRCSKKTCINELHACGEIRGAERRGASTNLPLRSSLSLLAFAPRFRSSLSLLAFAPRFRKNTQYATLRNATQRNY